MKFHDFWVLSLALALACGAEAQGAAAHQHDTAAAKTPASRQPGAPPRINAARAMQYTRDIVGMGPRPIGSRGHARVEAYLRSHLKETASNVQEDAFTAQTPAGAFPMRNIIAEYPGSRDGIIIIASHYDTNYPLRDENYVGANDGACTSALLLELGNQLRSTGKLAGYSVSLVFLDGEEAVKQWTDSDSLYGSRHLAEKWKTDGTTGKIKAFLLADMIGDKDLDIDRDQNSTRWLEDLVLQAATNLGLQSFFFARTNAVTDDHIPFAKAGVPVADLIDFTYGYNNVFWHTPQDTLDKLSPRSLEIAGNVLLETRRLLDQR